MAKLRRLPNARLLDLILYSLLGGLIGARIGYFLLYQDQFQGFWQVFYLWQGGLVAIFGLLSGFVTFLFLTRRYELPVWPLLDAGAFGLLVDWAIGKFGCHLSGCTVITSPELGNFVSPSSIDLFSTIWAFVLAGTLASLLVRHKLRDGATFFLVMEGLFLGEFLFKSFGADIENTTLHWEAAAYLVLAAAVYVVFLWMHGPKLKGSVTASLRTVTSRRR